MMNAAGKRDLEDTRRLAARGFGRISVFLLWFVGAYILIAPWLAPEWLGWNKMVRALGGESTLLRIAVGLLFIYFATLTHEKYALKFLTQDILHAFNMLLYGQDYRQHRAAVTRQIGLLASENARVRAAAHRVLRELTGQEFPSEHEPWAAWWKQARSTFRLAKGANPAMAGARRDNGGSHG